MCRLWILALSFLLLAGQGTSSAQNVLSNSGFEAGAPGGLPDEWEDQKEGGAEGRVILTDEVARSGKQCLLIEHTNADGYIHPNKSVEIQPGDYTFRFWAKSDGDIQFPAQIYQSTNWSIPLDELCSLKRDKWTEFEFPFSSLETMPGSIQIGLTAPGRLWLDDVELVKIGEAKGATSVKIMRSQGDMQLENGYFTVIFHSASGKVIIYSRSGEKRAVLMPLQFSGQAASITACKALKSSDDEAVIEACFSAGGIDSCAVFSFSKNQAIQIKPAENMEGISVLSPIQYAIVPSFISDDLILYPRDYSQEVLHIPSENFLLGLLEGENSMLVATWPDGKQKVRLTNTGGGLFKSISFQNDGKSLYLAILDAPGVWHEEKLERSYLEKDVTIGWKRPFPAKWITQLYEDGLKTTYAFRESRRDRFWRAGVGYYHYPVWFQGEDAFYHLGKKIPPKGKSLVYFLERMGTPVAVAAPVDILKQTLDSNTYERLVDSDGRITRSLTRPNNTVGTATCEVTDRIKAVFEAGEEVKKRDYVKGGTEDMIYFLGRERERALEYQDFAHEMIEFLTLTKKNRPELEPFLDKMENIAGELIDEFEHEKANIKDLDYARKLAEETQALTKRKSVDNYNAFLKLKGQWTAMGGAVDDLVRKLHTTTRKLFQQAGYSCVEQPEAVDVAEEIRKRTIKCLRKSGHYEIWDNY